MMFSRVSSHAKLEVKKIDKLLWIFLYERMIKRCVRGLVLKCFKNLNFFLKRNCYVLFNGIYVYTWNYKLVKIQRNHDIMC